MKGRNEVKKTSTKKKSAVLGLMPLKDYRSLKIHTYKTFIDEPVYWFRKIYFFFHRKFVQPMKKYRKNYVST